MTMSQVDLNKLSLEELASIQKEANAVIKAKQKEQVHEAYAQFQAIAKSLGLSIEEIIKTGKSAKTKRPAKYRNPQNAKESWSGQGRKPRWLEEQLAKGKKLEDFLIK